jgi:hypothetical protein
VITLGSDVGRTGFDTDLLLAPPLHCIADLQCDRKLSYTRVQTGKVLVLYTRVNMREKSETLYLASDVRTDSDA